jgi:hypothetical protein
LEIGIVVGNVESDSEDNEGVEENDSEGDFAGGELNVFVAVDVFVFCGCNGNGEEALEGEEYCVHG